LKYSVLAKAPTRIDLAGGTIDLWPIHQMLEKRATVNIGLSLHAEVEISSTPSDSFHLESVDQKLKVVGNFEEVVQNSKLVILSLMLKAVWKKEWGGLKITTRATSPAGAGLGGSSCLAVATAGAMLRMRKLVAKLPELEENALVELCKDVESNIIKVPAGCQDYWGAARGGVNIITFPPGQTLVQTLTGKLLHKLNENLIVCYSGQSRASGINNWAIFKKFIDGEKEMVAGLNKIGALAEESAEYAREENMEKLLKASGEEWQTRIKLFPQIETDHTKKLSKIANYAGATLGRVCGAGGGGVMVFFAPPAKLSHIKTQLSEAGGQVMDAKLCEGGLRVSHHG